MPLLYINDRSNSMQMQRNRVAWTKIRRKSRHGRNSSGSYNKYDKVSRRNSRVPKNTVHPRDPVANDFARRRDVKLAQEVRNCFQGDKLTATIPQKYFLLFHDRYSSNSLVGSGTLPFVYTEKCNRGSFDDPSTIQNSWKSTPKMRCGLRLRGSLLCV